VIYPDLSRETAVIYHLGDSYLLGNSSHAGARSLLPAICWRVAVLSRPPQNGISSALPCTSCTHSIRLQPFAELRARPFFFCFQRFWAGQLLQAQFSSIYLVSMRNLFRISMRSFLRLQISYFVLQSNLWPKCVYFGIFPGGQL
jgi:hypothetical protein